MKAYKAPDFSLVGDDDARHTLDDYKGSWLVLYFYPKDNTPGCTAQACSIRDQYSHLEDLGGTVVGVSMDTPEQHRAFRGEHQLPFVLLSDPMGETIRAYGAWGKMMFGREGIMRKTFIIDPSGMVRKVYHRATPLGHGSKLREDIRQLQSLR